MRIGCRGPGPTEPCRHCECRYCESCLRDGLCDRCRHALGAEEVATERPLGGLRDPHKAALRLPSPATAGAQVWRAVETVPAGDSSYLKDTLDPLGSELPEAGPGGPLCCAVLPA